MQDVWFVLYDGEDETGDREPEYIGRTISIEKAKNHFLKCEGNPNSVGKVVIITDNRCDTASISTNWRTLS